MRPFEVVVLGGIVLLLFGFYGSCSSQQRDCEKRGGALVLSAVAPFEFYACVERAK